MGPEVIPYFEIHAVNLGEKSCGRHAIVLPVRFCLADLSDLPFELTDALLSHFQLVIIPSEAPASDQQDVLGKGHFSSICCLGSGASLLDSSIMNRPYKNLTHLQQVLGIEESSHDSTAVFVELGPKLHWFPDCRPYLAHQRLMAAALVLYLRCRPNDQCHRPLADDSPFETMLEA